MAISGRMVCSSFGLSLICISTSIAAWRIGEPSIVLRTFVDFLSANADAIRAKAEHALSSIGRIKS